MKNNLDYLIPLKERDTKNFFFRIIKPTKKTWIISIVIFLSWYVGWFLAIRFLSTASTKSQYNILIISISITSVLSPVLGLFIWKWVCSFVSRKFIYETLKIKHEKKSEIREVMGQLKKEQDMAKFSFFRIFVSSLFGFDIHPDAKYYLEEKTYTIDISSFKSFFSMRLYDLVSASLGIGFLIASIVKYAISDIYVGFLAGSIVLLFSPIFVSWLTPVVWTIKDSRIKYVRVNNQGYELSERIRRSLVSRFFGVSAWIAGLSFFIDLFLELYQVNNPSLAFSVAIFFLSLAGVIIVALLAFGTLYLFGLLYHNFFHEKKVNDLRGALSEIIPYAQTNAIVSEESEHLI